jgi:hypothetical protein
MIGKTSHQRTNNDYLSSTGKDCNEKHDLLFAGKLNVIKAD